VQDKPTDKVFARMAQYNEWCPSGLEIHWSSIRDEVRQRTGHKILDEEGLPRKKSLMDLKSKIDAVYGEPGR
jgi:hypothetical protein